MNKHILVVYAHPEPKSFTASCRDVCIKTLMDCGYEVKQSDLYAMKFNPVISPNDFTAPTNKDYINYLGEQMNACATGTISEDIKEEMAKLKWADYIICIAPYYWGSIPAMLKGWFDRVLACGFAWNFKQTFKNGPLLGKTALLITTTGAPEAAYQQGGFQGMSIDERLHHVTWGVFNFCGMIALKSFTNFGVPTMTEEQRTKRLLELADYLKNLAAAPVISKP